MKYDFLIVGAGYAGSVLAERIATQLNKKCLIVEKRNHIAGNAYDYYDENGLLVHKFGPHIFHTNSKKVWDYLSCFTKWNNYVHYVKAYIDGYLVPIPFNLNSLYQVFPLKYAQKLEKKLIEHYGYGLKIPILKMMEVNDTELNFLANYIYKNVFHGYTLKQWGLKPEELDSSVTSRVPVYISKDNRYFQDTYQALPLNGYTEMFRKILNHKNIHLLLNVDFNEVKDYIKYDKLIFTGPIDSYFNYIYGELPYRSLEFEFRTFEQEFFQEIGQKNFPNNYDYTRITEFKHLTQQKHHFTTVAYEYPKQYIRNINEPYYPIPKEENNELYQKYKSEAIKSGKNVIFCGRLAEYKYYNMDQIVGIALQVFEKQIAGIR